MKCVYCSSLIWIWQSKKPLGPGPLPLYGQYEHTACHEKRAEHIAKNLASLPEEYRHLHHAKAANLYREGTS